MLSVSNVGLKFFGLPARPKRWAAMVLLVCNAIENSKLMCSTQSDKLSGRKKHNNSHQENLNFRISVCEFGIFKNYLFRFSLYSLHSREIEKKTEYNLIEILTHHITICSFVYVSVVAQSRLLFPFVLFCTLVSLLFVCFIYSIVCTALL